MFVYLSTGNGLFCFFVCFFFLSLFRFAAALVFFSFVSPSFISTRSSSRERHLQRRQREVLSLSLFLSLVY